MLKTILLTGATDGIGLQAAHQIAKQGHTLLLHGRNKVKLEKLQKALSERPETGQIEIYTADLSVLAEVEAFAKAVIEQHTNLDVLINNAGVFRAPSATTASGLDIRFVVNTLSPYLLTKRLLPLMHADGRVVNLSSAAQSPVNLEAMTGKIQLQAGEAYAQSKLAITMWTRTMAEAVKPNGPIFYAVNPGSLLATKMPILNHALMTMPPAFRPHIPWKW
ncbi:MAG: SDR family NAD(P)-dependent oxidoreductase, partial [Bacteroidota bacterium]